MAKFTKKAIVDTFISLLGKKPLSQITVKEITEICEINHNTFYYYFDDIYAVIDELFSSELKKLYDAAYSTGSLNEACTYALDLIANNKKAIRNIYNSVGRDQLLFYLIKVIEKVMNDFVNRFLKDINISEEDKVFIMSYHKCAMLGGILNWLVSGRDEELEIILLRFSSLTEQSLADYLIKTTELLGSKAPHT